MPEPIPDDAPTHVLRDEDDPHLDWHSDARGTMDAFANDIASRQIAGTAVALLRRAAAVLPAALPEADALECFEAHRALCAAAGVEPGTAASFAGWLVSRVLLRAIPGDEGAEGREGGYAITSVGLDFLRYIERESIPERPL